jgi:hypothetical protein
MSRNLILWLVYIALNFLSVCFLLTVLLFLNTFVNDLLIPESLISNFALLMLCRSVILLIEAGVWLVITFILNRLFLRKIAGYSQPSKLSLYTFLFECFFAFSVICVVMYRFYLRQ